VPTKFTTQNRRRCTGDHPPAKRFISLPQSPGTAFVYDAPAPVTDAAAPPSDMALDSDEDEDEISFADLGRRKKAKTQ